MSHNLLKTATMQKYWQKILSPGDDPIYYNMYKRFWKQPLEFEKLVVIADDGSGVKVEQSFTVLMIDARRLSDTNGKLLVRTEYRDALTALEAFHAKFPLKGVLILGYPGIGGYLHDKFPLALASALFRRKSWLNFFLLVSRLSQGKKTIMSQSASHRIYLFDESGLPYFTGTFVSDLIMDKVAYKACALVDSLHHKAEPNHILTASDAEVFMVYSSSPNPERYQHLQKQDVTLSYLLENWSFGEICAGFVQVLVEVVG